MRKACKIISAILALVMVIALCGLVGACQKTSDPQVVSISLNTQAAKKNYLTGDTFTADGVIVTARYESGDTETVDINDCTVTAPDMTTKGNKLVKVEYSGQSATYTITVEDRHVCTWKCPVCGKCLNATCTEEVCLDKCEGSGTEYTFEGEDANTVLIAGNLGMPYASKQEGADRTYIGGYDTGATVAYSVSASEATTANLKLTVSQREFKVTEKISIYVNGELLDRAPRITGSCEWFVFHEVNLGCINLVEGQNIISFVNSGVGVNFDKIVLTSSATLGWYTDSSFTLNTEEVTKTFPVGSEFTSEGLAATLTVGGNSEEISCDDPDLQITVPDMANAGKKTVTVIYKHYYVATYEIEVQVNLDGKTANEFAGIDTRVTLTDGEGGAIRYVGGHLDNLNNNYGASFTFNVYSPEACKSDLWIKAGQRVFDIVVTDVLGITVNGETYTTDAVMPKTSGGVSDWHNFIMVPLGEVDLVQGLNTITFTVGAESENTKGRGFNVESITLATDGVDLRWYYGLTLDASAVKTEYEFGEEFGAEGLVVKYTEGADETTLTAEDYDISSPDMLSAGEKTVTVSYNGFVETFTITVKPDTAVREEYKFIAGEKATLAGGAVAQNKASEGATPDIWIDGINEKAGASITFEIYSPQSAVTTVGAIINTMAKDKKFTDVMTVTVNGVELTSDAVIAYSQNNGWVAVEVPVSISGVKLVEGKNTVIFTMTGNGGFWFKALTVSSPVELIWYYGEMTVDASAVKTEYEFGDTFSAEGLVVKCELGGVETTLTADDYTISPVDMLTAGEKTVTITYHGLNATYTITVKPEEVVKETYTFDDPTKAELDKAYVSDKGNGDMWIDGLNGASAVGATVTYSINSTADGTATLTVMINKMRKGEKFTDVMTITVNGAECAFETAIDFVGTATPWNSEIAEVTIGGITLKQGLNTITFTVAGNDAFWFKGIKLESAAELSLYYGELTVDTTAAKTVYTEGDTFTADGIVVKCVLGGVLTTIDASDYTVSQHDLGLKGTQTVTVTYRHLKVTYDITVEGEDPLPYSFNAYDGKAEIAGGLTANTATGYIDRVNDVSNSSAYIEYEVYSSKAAAAKLIVTQNTMQNGKTFTNIFSIIVNGEAYTTDAVISYTQASGWAAVWVEVDLGNIQLKQGVNTIRFAKACAGDGFWFRSITLETTAKLDWCYSDYAVDSSAVKKTYNAGEAFNAEGLVVTCNVYGVPTTLTAQDYTVSSPNMFAAGEKTVIVSYPAGGLSATFTITVNAGELSTTKVEFPAYDGKATIGGGLTANTTNNYIDRINDATAGTIVYKINSSEDCIANLTILMNKMQKGSVFTDLVSINVNGTEYKFAEAIDFEGNNVPWTLGNWVQVTLGSIALQQGENTITLTTKCQGKGFWFQGIALESEATLTWATEA